MNLSIKSIFVVFLVTWGLSVFAQAEESQWWFQQELEHKTMKTANEFPNLKFLSYNIQLNGLDIPTHLWKDRKYAICTLISYADVIVLQEITHAQFIDLKAMLSEYDFFGFNTVTGNDLIVYSSDIQEGLAIAFRKDIFSLKSTELMWYSDTPNVPSQKWGNWISAFPKSLQKSTLVYLSNGKEIDILNSHFAHDEDLSGVINPRLLSSQMELQILEGLNSRCWISAGDRNFHNPRDIPAYEFYANSSYVSDSKTSALHALDKTTFLGYEDHPRMNPITPEGEFEKFYYLDVVFHNPEMMQSRWWISHIGEYDENLKLLPIGPCRSPAKRFFASDHSAIFVEYVLEDRRTFEKGDDRYKLKFAEKEETMLKVNPFVSINTSNEKTFQIRSAQAGDENSLYKLICELAAFEGKDISSLPLTKENLHKFGFCDNPYFFTELGEVDGKIVGYALYFYTFSANQGLPILYLEDLYVKPEYRKQGIGLGLLKQLARFASVRQCCRLEWHVFDWNESAIKFYQKIGGVFKDDLIQMRLEKESLLQLANDEINR